MPSVGNIRFVLVTIYQYFTCEFVACRHSGTHFVQFVSVVVAYRELLEEIHFLLREALDRRAEVYVGLFDKIIFR